MLFTFTNIPIKTTCAAFIFILTSLCSLTIAEDIENITSEEPTKSVAQTNVIETSQKKQKITKSTTNVEAYSKTKFELDPNPELESKLKIETEPESEPEPESDPELIEKIPMKKRLIIGWVERISLRPEKLLLDAKLTPGSEGNVLHAENISEIVRKGEKWVQFTLVDRKGNETKLERKLIGKSTFRTTNSKKQKRYLVESGICLNHTYLVIEFALADRSEFEQKVRLGRETLAGHFIIDPAKTKTVRPKCKIPDESSK